MKPRARLIDIPTSNRLNDLFTHAIENGLQLLWHYDGLRAPDHWHIVQLWDEKETIIVLSGRGKDLSEAVRDLYEKLLKKTPKVLE